MGLYSSTIRGYVSGSYVVRHDMLEMYSARAGTNVLHDNLRVHCPGGPHAVTCSTEGVADSIVVFNSNIIHPAGLVASPWAVMGPLNSPTLTHLWYD